MHLHHSIRPMQLIERRRCAALLMLCISYLVHQHKIQYILPPYLGKNILQLQYIAISPPKYTLQCIELLQYILLRIKILQYILDRLETIAIYIGALFITVPCFNHIILALNRWYWCNILQYIGCNNYCNVLEYCNIYCRSLIYCNIYCQSFRYCNTYCCWQIFPINMQYIFPKVSLCVCTDT